MPRWVGRLTEAECTYIIDVANDVVKPHPDNWFWSSPDGGSLPQILTLPLRLDAEGQSSTHLIPRYRSTV